MKTENLEIWNRLKRPPASALKQIKGGRISGMTDISPQWRYEVMTENFGPIGTGWYYEIVKTWSEKTIDDQVSVYVMINLFVGDSKPIFGLGGSMLYTKESKGFYHSDECYKMALTDALSVAMKQLGVGADIYMGLWDGSKYKDAPKKNVLPDGNYDEAMKFFNEKCDTIEKIDYFIKQLDSKKWKEGEKEKLLLFVAERKTNLSTGVDKIVDMFDGEVIEEREA